MYRVFVLSAVLLVAAGCQDPPPAGFVEMGNSHCADVASQRAKDAAYNGFSSSIQQAVFDKVYKDCLAKDPPVVRTGGAAR